MIGISTCHLLYLPQTTMKFYSISQNLKIKEKGTNERERRVGEKLSVIIVDALVMGY